MFVSHLLYNDTMAVPIKTKYIIILNLRLVATNKKQNKKYYLIIIHLYDDKQN
jgi:hypothetical protein